MTIDTGPENEALFARYGVEWHEYHGICEKRRRQQLWTLRKFAIGLGAERTMLDVTSSDIKAWLDAKRTQGLLPSTIRLHLNYFRPFYTWAYEARLIDSEHLLDIRSVRPPNGSALAMPRPYNRRERERFWADFERTYPWTRKREERERGAMFFERYLAGRSRWGRVRCYLQRLQAEAIVNLAMVGGLRRIEIFNLDLDDMEMENEYLIAHTAKKATESDRAVPWLTAGMREAVGDWLEARERLEALVGGFGHDRPWLNLGQREPWLFTALPLNKFVATVARCGDWRFHRMRHTAVTEMCRAGIPIQTVRGIAGHANIAMTTRYLELLPEDVVREAQRAEARIGRAFRREEAA